MVNYLKWGLIGALVVGIVAFREPIKNAIVGAGKSLGEAVGGGASGFIGGAVSGATGGIFGQPYDINKKGTVPLYDIFFNGIPKAEAQTIPSNGGDPVANKDNSSDPAITPYNREYVAKLEWSAAKHQTGFHGQATETARQFIQSGNRIVVAENQARDYMAAYNGAPQTGHAEKVRYAQKTAGTTVSPLALFYLYKAQGLSNSNAMRKVKEQTG